MSNLACRLLAVVVGSVVSISTTAAADPSPVAPRIEAQITHPKADNLRDGPPVFSPDGTVFATYSEKVVFLWNTRTGKLRSTLNASAQGVIVDAVAFTPDSKSVCLAYWGIKSKEKGEAWGALIECYDLVTLKLQKRVVPPDATGAIRRVAMSSDGQYLAYQTKRRVSVYDLTADKVAASLDCEYEAEAIRFDNTSKRLVVAGVARHLESQLVLLDIKEAESRKVDVLRAEIRTIAVHPKSNAVLTAGGHITDGKLGIWDPATGKRTGTLDTKVFNGTQRDLAISFDGRFLAAAGRRDELVVHRLDGQQERVAAIPTKVFHNTPRFVISPSEDRLLLFGYDATNQEHVIQYWSLTSRRAADGRTASELDQLDMEREIVLNEPVDEEYFRVFGRARYESWKTDAAAGCKCGQFLLGCALLRGTGGVKSEAKGLELLEKAAAQSNPMALIYLASLERNEPKKAFQRYSGAAETKHPLALEYLAGCYRDGVGVKRDAAKAFELSLAAAEGERGCSSAMISVGVGYQTGAGGKPAPEQAARYFQRAAERGHPDGHYHLGMCYLNGAGVPQNAKRAVELLATGARLGSLQAQLNYAFCLERGEGCTKDLEAALGLYRTLARQEHPVAVKKVKEIEAIQAAKRSEELDRLLLRYQPLPSYSAASAGDAGRLREHAIYEAQRSAWEAQRNYRNDVGGRLGATAFNHRRSCPHRSHRRATVDQEPADPERSPAGQGRDVHSADPTRYGPPTNRRAIAHFTPQVWGDAALRASVGG